MNNLAVKSKLAILLTLLAVVGLSACNEEAAPAPQQEPAPTETTNSEETVALKNNIELSSIKGFIRDNVEFTVNELAPNTDTQLVWAGMDGKYLVEDLYVVIGSEYTEQELVLAEGKSDENGIFKGSFAVPDGFGWDHTIYAKTDDTKVGQVNYTVTPEFSISPTSGPVGTEITITAKGIGWSTYMRNWQLTYDNAYTGLISAVSTNGTGVAKIRATGEPGDHILSIRTGYLGMPYINQTQSPRKNKPTPNLVFTVTDEAPLTEHYVEPIPVAADGGVEMPKLVNKSGVEVALDKAEGVVGEANKMTATGLPKNQEVELIWSTMKGSRVSGLGFAEEIAVLDTVTTDDQGSINYDFPVPDDLGGIPHRIDLKIGDEIHGQAYLRILPSVIEFSPKSGPVGTKIKVVIKGGGWTEFDNAYYMTYDNSYNGYMCSFNSQGTLEFDIIATGQPGYHTIDLYPGIYKQAQEDTDMALIPQLTYAADHPGSAMPAIRLGFEVTE